jgi:hypothetical protein
MTTQSIPSIEFGQNPMDPIPGFKTTVRTKPNYQKELSADHVRQPPDVVDVPAFVDRLQVLQDVVVVVLGVAILKLKQKQIRCCFWQRKGNKNFNFNLKENNQRKNNQQ